MTEPIGMIHTMIDDSDDSTIEVAISRAAMDMISGKPGMNEAEFVDRFADEVEALVDDVALVGARDEAGRVVISSFWVQDMRPWLATVEHATLDAFGRLN